MVDIYAPWWYNYAHNIFYSKPCKAFAPVFEELAAEIYEAGLDVVSGKLDGTVAGHLALIPKFHVLYYPTIGLLKYFSF